MGHKWPGHYTCGFLVAAEKCRLELQISQRATTGRMTSQVTLFWTSYEVNGLRRGNNMVSVGSANLLKEINFIYAEGGGP